MGSIFAGHDKITRLRRGQKEPISMFYGDEQMFPSGETRLWLHLTSNLNVSVFPSESNFFGGNAETEIDYGDGAAITRSTSGTWSKQQHTYQSAGDYCVRWRLPLNREALGGATASAGTVQNILSVAADLSKQGTSPEVTRLTIGNDVRVIYGGAFAKMTSLAIVTIPRWIQQVNRQAFAGCTGLIFAEVGANNIGDSLFDCSGGGALRKIWIRDNVEIMSVITDQSTQKGPFFGISPGATLYCEADEKPAGWQEGWNLISGTDVYAPVVWGQKARPW